MLRLLSFNYNSVARWGARGSVNLYPNEWSLTAKYIGYHDNLGRRCSIAVIILGLPRRKIWWIDVFHCAELRENIAFDCVELPHIARLLDCLPTFQAVQKPMHSLTH